MKQSVQQTIEEVFQRSSRHVFASLVRSLGDFDLAEDAMQDAFASATAQWPVEGVPANAVSWLISVGRFKAIDRIRQSTKLSELAGDIAKRIESINESNHAQNFHSIEDDRLRLIVTCCHPAIDPSIQVPLTLREVCGLTTEQIGLPRRVAALKRSARSCSIRNPDLTEQRNNSDGLE